MLLIGRFRVWIRRFCNRPASILYRDSRALDEVGHEGQKQAGRESGGPISGDGQCGPPIVWIMTPDGTITVCK
jgi:hypothetical protein